MISMLCVSVGFGNQGHKEDLSGPTLRLLMDTQQPDFFRSLDSDIDPVSWINNLLQNGAREPSDLNSLEKHLNNVIPALEVASEDLSLHIERLIEEISRSASRLPYDLHFMRDGALSVQIALNSVTNRSTSFSPQSS